MTLSFSSLSWASSKSWLSWTQGHRKSFLFFLSCCFFLHNYFLGPPTHMLNIFVWSKTMGWWIRKRRQKGDDNGPRERLSVCMHSSWVWRSRTALMFMKMWQQITVNCFLHMYLGVCVCAGIFRHKKCVCVWLYLLSERESEWEGDPSMDSFLFPWAFSCNNYFWEQRGECV